MGKTRVLIVDDEEDLADMIRQMLELFDFEVECAADGRTGIVRASEWRPELAVVDLMLPDVDGFEVCQALRSMPGAPVGLVVLTGLINPQAKEKALAAGADRFLTKPFDPNVLVEQLKSLAGK
jgi:DNA-binding response OmpR family regulator